MTIKQFIEKYEPSCEGADWLRIQRSLKSAWNKCLKPDWMLWVLNKIEYQDESTLRLFACWCVRYTPHAQNAVEIAEQYAKGEITLKKMNIARAAAWAATAAAREAAWNAADAARAAASKAAWNAAAWTAAWEAAWHAAGAAQANRLRKVISWEVVEKLIKKNK